MNLTLIIAVRALALLSHPSFAQPAPGTPLVVAGVPVPAAASLGLRREIDRLKSSFQTLSGGVSLFAFFDVQGTSLGDASGVVSTGDLEVDLAKGFGKDVQVGAAVVLNKEGVALAAGFVDIRVFGGLDGPTGGQPVPTGFHLQLGRQDVPFGIDWQHFAARDRTGLSAPLTTDVLLGGGYSGTGLRVLGTTGRLDYSAFAFRVDGPGNLYGGRLGFRPFTDSNRFRQGTIVVEAGVSGLDVVGPNGATHETALALDADARIGRCRVQAEVVRKHASGVEGRDGRAVRWGWYATTTFDAGVLAGVPTTLYARYDTVTGDPGAAAASLSEGAGPASRADAGRTARLTAGVNAAFFELVLLKLEYQRFLAASAGVRARDGFERGALCAQAVVVF